jgi:TP901 family phage tail tape measure protein
MATVGDVRVKFFGDTRGIQTGLRKVGAAMKKLGTIALRIGKVLVLAFAGLGIAAIKAATTIEGAFRTIQVGTGATGKSLRRLQRSFTKVFQDVPESANTVAGALANVNTLFGVSGKDAEALTKQILDFTRLVGGDASQNALQFGRAMKQFGINAKDSTDLLDTFFKITQETGISFERLTRDLREFGPVLKLANIGADEGARLISRLSAEGINFTRVSPALRQGFINFAKAGKNARVELEKVIERVKNAGSEEEAVTILTENFGTEVGRLAVVMRSGAFALDTNTKAVNRNRGAIKKTEEETRTFGDEIGKIRNKIVIALKPAGDAFLAMFRAVLPQLEAFIQKTGKDMPNLVLKGFEAIAKAVQTFGPGFIQAFNGIVIAMKSVALAAIAVAIAFQTVQQSKAINAEFFGRGTKERVAEVTESLANLKTAFGNIKGSISLNVEGIAQAQEKADKWAGAITKVKDEFAAAQEKSKDVGDETDEVKVNTEQVFKNIQALKEPSDQFIGSLEVAGKTIDIQVNSRLEVSRQKLVEINRLMAQAANNAGGT